MYRPNHERAPPWLPPPAPRGCARGRHYALLLPDAHLRYRVLCFLGVTCVDFGVRPTDSCGGAVRGEYDVRDRVPVMAVYKRLGWQIQGETPRYNRTGGSKTVSVIHICYANTIIVQVSWGVTEQQYRVSCTLG